MRNLVIAVGMVAALSSCTQTEKGTAIGAASGAVVGGHIPSTTQRSRSAEEPAR